jgi:XTP/dITP diphosphohydrolase
VVGALPPRIVVATGNRGKLAELAAMLGGAAELIAADDVAPGWSVEEDGATFAANARKKALHLARLTGLPALGDDSGLAVDALGGRPGVRSARYAGEDASDAQNVTLLLRELASVPDGRRQAAFHCALVLAWPDGRMVEVEERCEGTIAAAPRGQGGFGYDPVFVDPETGRTFAELPAATKNARSHRGRAALALLRALAQP